MSRSDWLDVKLGDVCEFGYGKALPEKARRSGEVPVYGSNGAVGVHDSALSTGATIVVGRKGSAGRVSYSPVPCWPIDTTYFVDHTKTAADLPWLAYRLAGLGLDHLKQSVAVPGLSREDAYRVRLLLPPLREQRRLADILDRADAMRATRRQSIALLDSLTQSIFDGMFADAERRWPTATVADVAAASEGSIRTGPFGSQLLHSEFSKSGVEVLGIDNAVENRFAWGSRRFISERKYQSRKRYTVRPGDVLITIMGTCGRCAVVPQDIPVAINTKHLCCVTLDHSRCLPEFLHAYFLRHASARRYLEQKAKGAIMAGLNMGVIKSMPFPLVPPALQRKFVERVAAVDMLQAAHRASLAEMDALFASLQHRAFRGEL